MTHLASYLNVEAKEVDAAAAAASVGDTSWCAVLEVHHVSCAAPDTSSARRGCHRTDCTGPVCPARYVCASAPLACSHARIEPSSDNREGSRMLVQMRERGTLRVFHNFLADTKQIKNIAERSGVAMLKKNE